MDIDRLSRGGDGVQWDEKVSRRFLEDANPMEEDDDVPVEDDANVLEEDDAAADVDTTGRATSYPPLRLN